LKKQIQKKTNVSDFANFGQAQGQFYDPSDIDENDEMIETENLMVEPEEDDIELLERFFLRTKNKSSRYSQLKIWSMFLKKIEINAPELYKVLEFMLIIPNGTAEVERFFKVLKDMKSKKRNNLSARKLRKFLKIYFFLDDDLDAELLYRCFTSEYENLSS